MGYTYINGPTTNVLWFREKTYLPSKSFDFSAMGKHIVNEFNGGCLVRGENLNRFWKASKDGAGMVWQNNTPHRGKRMTCESRLEFLARDMWTAHDLNCMQIWHERHGVCQLRQRFICGAEEDGHDDNSGAAEVKRRTTAE
jgi:hypothetical protein